MNAAVPIAKKIIFEMTLPIDLKSIKPLDVGGVAGKLLLSVATLF